MSRYVARETKPYHFNQIIRSAFKADAPMTRACVVRRGSNLREKYLALALALSTSSKR